MPAHMDLLSTSAPDEVDFSTLHQAEQGLDMVSCNQSQAAEGIQKNKRIAVLLSHIAATLQLLADAVVQPQCHCPVVLAPLVTMFFNQRALRRRSHKNVLLYTKMCIGYALMIGPLF